MTSSQAISKDDVEEMLPRFRPSLIKKRKRAQIQNLAIQGQRSELEEAIHARLVIQELSLEKFSFPIGFVRPILASYQKELGLPFQDYLIQERMKKKAKLTPGLQISRL